jgi:thermosome
MVNYNTNQPIFILPEDTKRFLGRDAQRMNIIAGKILAETVKTTLGPKGMDKMLVDNMSDVVISNDGVTILREMDITHPAAKMLVEIAKNQEDVVGDGTTTAVIIAGELLKKAEKLFDEGIHATVIIRGYKQAVSKIHEILNDISIDAKDKDTLMKVAMTAMGSKGSEKVKRPLAKLIVDALIKITENDKVDKKNINIQRVSGASIDESEIIDGILVDKGKADPNMPKEIKNAKIALLKYPLEVKNLETDAKINIKSPDQVNAFLENEEQVIHEMINKIIDSGANVLFCQKSIDDKALNYLSRAGILAIKRTKKSDMNRLEKATSAKIATNLDDLTTDDLGKAGIVYEKKIFDQMMIFIEKCRDPKAISIILRGSTKHITAEIERTLEDALGSVSTTIEDGKIVPGGGATEIEISRQLKEHAEYISGREQLAINAFAEALEIIPSTLAENAGLDTINILADLRAAHEQSEFMGLDVFKGEITDMKKNGVIEPQKVKKQAIQSAAETIEIILRIDDIIAAKGALETADADENLDNSGMPPMGGGMPPIM